MNIFESRPHLRVLRAHRARMANLKPGQDDGLPIDCRELDIARNELKLFNEERSDAWLTKQSAKYKKVFPYIIIH